MEPFSIEQFERLSIRLQEFFGVRKGIVSDLDLLILYGAEAVPTAFDEWSLIIHSAQPHNPDPVEFAAWSNHLDCSIVAPTAHECAALVFHTIWKMVFPVQPQLPWSPSDPDIFWNAAEKYIAANRLEIDQRWKDMIEKSAYPEWLRIAARMKIELAHVQKKYRSSPMIAANGDIPQPLVEASIPSNRSVKKRPSVNAVVLNLFQNNPESIGWSLRKLEAATGCSRTAISDCKAYTQAKLVKAGAKIGRLEKQSGYRGRDGKRRSVRPDE